MLSNRRDFSFTSFSRAIPINFLALLTVFEDISHFCCMHCLTGYWVCTSTASLDAIKRSRVRIQMGPKKWQHTAEMEFANIYLIWVGPMLKLCSFVVSVINLSYGKGGLIWRLYHSSLPAVPIIARYDCLRVLGLVLCVLLCKCCPAWHLVCLFLHCVVSMNVLKKGYYYYYF